MPRRSLFLLLALWAGWPGIAQGSDAPPPRIPRLAQAPVLDGQLDEWLARTPDLVLDRAEQLLPARRDRWDGPEDLSARGWWGLYGTELWLALEIRDDQVFHDTSAPWWQGDSVEVFVDAGREAGRAGAEAYGPDCLQLFLLPAHPHLPWGVVWRGTTSRFDDGGLEGLAVRHRRVTADLTHVEMRLDLADLGIGPGPERALGFALAINDADEAPGDPGSYLSWNAAFDLYRLPSHFSEVTLPERGTPIVRAPSAPAGPSTWTLLAMVLGTLLATALLIGPASATLARLPTGTLAAVLLGLALIGWGLGWLEERGRGTARAALEERLAARARDAEAVVVAARAVGALGEATPSARAQSLETLLEGGSVPAAPGVEAAAFVPLRADGRFAAPPGGGYEVELGRALDLPLPEPIAARSARLELVLPHPRRDATRLGTFALEAARGERAEMATVVPAGAAGAVTVTLEVPAAPAEGWARLRWTPAPAAVGALLRRVLLVEPGSGERPLRLPTWTGEGVPVLAHPRLDAPDVRVAPRGRLDLELPGLLGGADRLWLVLGAEEASSGGIVRAEIRYADGTTQTHELLDGVHLGPSRRAEGIPRPSGRRSRVAFDWTGSDGFRYEREAVPLPLDPQRRPERLTLENQRDARALILLAATLVRTRRTPDDAPVRVVLDDEAAADRAVLSAPRDDLAALLASSGGRDDDAERVRHQALLKVADTTVPLLLEGRVDEDTQAGARRIGLARLGVLGLGVLAALLLAAALARRLPTMGWRLGVGVLVAALLPLVVTLVLLETKQRHRLLAETQRTLDEATSATRAGLGHVVEETQQLARRLARHMRAVSEATPPEQWTAAVRSVLPAEVRGSVLVRTRREPALVVALGDEPLTALRVLEETDGEAQITTSPWDGLLVIARARAGRDESVEVIVGRRIGDDDLAAWQPAAARDPISIALVNERGRLLAGAGVAPAFPADRFARLRRAEGDAASSGRHGDALLGLEPVREGGRGPGDAAWIVAARPAAALDAAIAEERIPLIWLGLLGFLLVAASAALVARQVAAPVAALARASDAMRLGDFDAVVPAAGADEVGRLARAFEQMRLDLRERMEDMDALRHAQDHLAEHLDHDVCAARVLDLLHGTSGADATWLLEAHGAPGPVAVLGHRRGAGEDVEAETGDGRSVDLDEDLAAVAAGTEARWLQRATTGTPPATVAPLLGCAQRWFALPLTSGGAPAALALLGWADGAAALAPAAARRLPPLAGMAAAALHRAHLYRVALLDEVTRVPGATAFEARLRRDVNAVMQGGPELTLLRLGLDHLEHHQRERGVEAARRILRAVAAAVLAEVGDARFVGRLAAGELGVRLIGRTPGAVRELAERLRERVSRLEIVGADGEVLATTLSIGIATCPGDARSVEFLGGAAAGALAAARREGGDRVEEAERLARGAVDVPPFEEGAVFRSQAMVLVVEAARRAARSEASVLITGETGTGKEVIATLLHRRSARSARPLVSVNCAAFPETLLESELFGHERGAFTGAERRREGRFEVADGGTLFLDEIGEMSPSAQVKLLRVLQERQVTRLGGSRPITVDVRILAATNQDLEQAVEAGRFREDLYYRLNVIRLEIPPLRERREEIPLLVDLFLAEMRQRSGRGPERLAPTAMDLLYRHAWPGNVRELKNVIERCSVLCDEDEAGPEHIHLDPTAMEARGDLVPRRAPGDDLNRRQQAVLAHLARHGRCTSREYCELTGTSVRTALRDLSDLIDRGLLIREGKRRGAIYRLA